MKKKQKQNNEIEPKKEEKPGQEAEENEKQEIKIKSITQISENEPEEQEIIEEPEENEEELEEEVEIYQPQFDDTDFSQFITTQRTASLLEQGELEIPDTSIENIAETAPPTATTQQAFDYTSATGATVGEPDYSGSRKYENLREEEKNIMEMREHGVLGSAEDTGLHQVRLNHQMQTAWGSELQDPKEGPARYQERAEQETRKLPFERKSRLKERRI